MAHLYNEHVDDSCVLDVLVLDELRLEHLLAFLLRDWHRHLRQHDGDLSPPRLVEGNHSKPGLLVVQRQQGFHLEKQLRHYGIRSRTKSSLGVFKNAAMDS